jgi:D-alanyl-lipoteichoic acid acyltransferase DltB (MBOAT superfamily)
MLFNSHEFIFVFCPAVFAVFFLIAARNFRLALAWLVGASLFFYAWWNPPYLLLLLGSVLFNYAAGLLLSRAARRRRTLLGGAVAANLLLLGYFKYTNFLIGTWNAVSGAALPLFDILLPLAISFHTFQQIAYLVDTYRGETGRYRFLDYLFFVVFFPQLIAGPIVRHDEIIPQVSARRTWRPDPADLALGITIFSFGLFKKVVLADSVAVPADLVFGAVAAQPIGLLRAWTGAFAYALQIYFDFSAYSDMAVGLALLAGIRFPLNFFSPYQATSVVDFWRRWHMTLSRFLLHYLYIPLGGNRRGRARRYVNLMATMLLGGLWHGAAWTFVVWGGLHGAYLAINHAWRGTQLAATWARSRAWRLLSVALTFTAVCVAWVFFRAPDFPTALEMLKAMAGLNGLRVPGSVPLNKQQVLTVLGGLVIVFGMPNIYMLMERFRPVLSDLATLGSAPPPRWAAWRPAAGWAIAGAAAFCAGALLISKESPFLYFQF